VLSCICLGSIYLPDSSRLFNTVAPYATLAVLMHKIVDRSINMLLVSRIKSCVSLQLLWLVNL